MGNLADLRQGDSAPGNEWGDEVRNRRCVLGKGIRGPQGTGILCGKENLIDAAFACASPHQFFGRGMKVAKEEIIGLMQALEMFVNEDEDAEMKRYREMSQHVVDALIEVPGIKISVEHDEWDYLIPHAIMKFEDGPDRRDAIYEAIVNGDPPVYLQNIHNPDELGVDPFNLDEQELEIVRRRLREELTRR